ncbi:MAG: DeoR/GlpR transcriptional regulator [Anaerolineales bacterium]|nr:DeoR/GlpR transcriptional regulator [Anaerolineales bacterium]
MTKALIPAQRHEKIQEFLALHKVVTTTDLCSLLHISEATVRRDLECLEKKGIIERTHGGAILSQRLRLEPQYNQRAQQHQEEKRLIGQAAAALVEPGDIIFVNSGTTTTEFIHHIREKTDITVITNNLNACHDLSEINFELIFLGGTFQPRSISVAGHITLENIRQINASKAFIGVDGLSLKYGCTVPSEPEVGVVRRMIERAQGPVTVLADYSKWGVVSNFEIATIDQIERLITDENFDPRAKSTLESRSIDVILAAEIR